MKKIFNFNNRTKATRFGFALLWFFSLAALILPANLTFASPAAEQLKEGLRRQINELQQQINQYRTNIKDLQQQGKTLKREISLLDSKIKTALLEVRQTELAVEQTENEIADKDLAMEQAELKLNREKEIMAEYLRLIYEYDQQDFLEIILKNDKLSDIFDEVNSLENVQQKIQESMAAIAFLKIELEDDRQTLEEQREDFNQLKVLQEIQHRVLAIQQEEKKDLLTQTKGQEVNFQKLLEKAKADTVSIRKNLYLLEGVGLTMPLEQAYRYAKKAGDLTGVRPAFLLAVLKKESSWGEKVGTGTWRRDMHSRDQKAFIEICDKLNLDPDKTLVSRKPSYGWGGAMGPAQFLPSVWLAYEARVAQLTGHSPPDPWDIEDAFVAAALKLVEGGANVRFEEAEWKAAQIYFAGRRWNNPTYYFYGDQVMELAAVIQEQLNLIV